MKIRRSGSLQGTRCDAQGYVENRTMCGDEPWKGSHVRLMLLRRFRRLKWIEDAINAN